MMRTAAIGRTDGAKARHGWRRWIVTQKNARTGESGRAKKAAERLRTASAYEARGRGPARRDGHRRSRLGRLRDLGGRAVVRARIARLDHEALLERCVDALFDVVRLLAHHFGDFGDDQRLGAIEHALLAEREALRLAQERQALEHIGHVVDGAGAHLVGVVLETAFPVLVIVDLAVAEEAEQPLDFFVA